jgi:steroid delta-isomerase-like uncharacterized protein
MSAAANAALGRAFFEAQDRLRGGPDDRLCAAAYSAQIGGNPPMSLEGHQQFATAFYSAFPDLQHSVDEVVADDASVAVRFTLRGLHSGAFMGIPPTGKSIEVGAVAILRVEDGRVRHLQGQFDQMGMMRQLGVLPAGV